MSESLEQNLLSPAWGHLNTSPIVRTRPLMEYFSTGTHDGDSAVAVQVALAALAVIQRESLIDNSSCVGVTKQ